MKRDDVIYFMILVGSILIGFIFKNILSKNLKNEKVRIKYKSIASSVIGFSVVLLLCGLDSFHSLLMIIINSILIKFTNAK
jgi:hypothetical protein